MEFRTMRVEDIEGVKAVVAQGGPYLSLNGNYNYWMMATIFSDYSYVAVENGEVCGVVTTLPHPKDKLIFVWQLGVAPAYRHQGVAFGLLENVIVRLKAEGYNGFVTSITETNAGSMASFAKIARTYHMTRERIGAYETPEIAEDLYQFTFAPVAGI